MIWKSRVICLVAGVLISGCATRPANPLFTDKADVAATKEIMARKDQIIQIPTPITDGGRPVLLLLHGATDDPTEMMDIVREWRGTYDVFLYAYNCHIRVQTVASDFVKEVERLKTANRFHGPMTIVVYSYAAIVFREAVISADDRTVFAGVYLIQMVPTAGGSFFERSIKNPLLAWVISLVSHPAYAENPWGRFAEQLWAGAGNRKFYSIIPPDHMHTLCLEGDPHSLAGVADEQVRERYRNGLGPNVVLIPKSSRVTHDYFPTNPVALGYLRRLLAPPPEAAEPDKMQVASPGRKTGTAG